MSTKDKYRWVGRFYDALAHFYSGGTIRQSKLAMIKAPLFRHNVQCLFAGAGHGEDAILAAQLGAEVTVVDISPTMLGKLRERLERVQKRSPESKLNINIIEADILSYSAARSFDVVVINFFLNVFDDKTMNRMFERLVDMTAKGGHVVIGDFHYPSQGGYSRLVFLTYWGLAMLVFWLAAGNAIHRVCDYEALAKRRGLQVQTSRSFTLLSIPITQSFQAQKLL